MNYDTKKTEIHKKESMFEIHGYHQEFYYDGKMIAQKRHDKIPFGCNIGGLGRFLEIKEDTVFELRGKKTKIKKGEAVRVCIMPICGRLKK